MTDFNNAGSKATSARRHWFTQLAAIGGMGLLGAQALAKSFGQRQHLSPDDRLNRRIDRLIAAVNGSPEQKEQLLAIAGAALADLRPMREQLRQARRSALELLTAPVIDKRALEQQRLMQLQLADAKSQRLLQALIDGAEVLTPQQRAQAAQHLSRHAHYHNLHNSN